MPDPTLGELNVPYVQPSDPPDGPALALQIAQAIQKLDTVATIAALPTSGNWPGRVLRVRNVPGADFWSDGTVTWTMYGIPTFATEAARDAAIPAPVNGMRTYITALGTYTQRTAGAWVYDDTGWINATLLNSWVVSAGLTVQYRRVNGVVYSQGQVTGGAPNSTIFALPVGFRPPTQTMKFAAPNTDGTTIYRVSVDTSGQVTANNAGTSATPVTNFAFPV